jgi:hypothetical protein
LKNEAIPMDCATFQDIVHDLDRAGTPGAKQCESALAHAESCESCAALLTQVEWLEFSLAKLTEIGGGRQASPRLEATLLRELRSTKDFAARKQLRWRLAALTTAAALFLVLGLALRHRGLSSPVAVHQVAIQSPHNTPQLGSVPSSENTRPAAPVTLDPHTTNPVVVLSQPASHDSDDADGTPDAASFFRLPYADNSAALDGGAIVRVKLPRAALASFGLPVADTGDTRRILADLIVSADGTPEAIRLISQASASE